MFVNKRKEGFTLIEIVIVLAIAALIMVIVFVAVQGAQRSRRDTQRKKALDSIVGQLENYSANNNGKYPNNNSQWNNSSNSFINLYVDGRGEYVDPTSGNQYSFSNQVASFSDFSDTNTQCASGFKGNSNENGAGSVVYAIDTSTNKYKLRMCLESEDYEYQQ